MAYKIATDRFLQLYQWNRRACILSVNIWKSRKKRDQGGFVGLLPMRT